MPKKNEHIVIRNTSHGAYEMECLHCGMKYEPAMPCPMSIFLRIIKQFGQDHLKCQKETKHE